MPRPFCLKTALWATDANMAYDLFSRHLWAAPPAIVVATGMETEVGQIANMLEEQDALDTPLKRKLNAVGKALTVAGLIICCLIFTIGALYHRPLVPQFLVAISLAISIIPEGLPATATIVMDLGRPAYGQKKCADPQTARSRNFRQCHSDLQR